MPDIINKPKKWDGKKPHPDMGDNDYVRWETTRREQCLDDCDHYMNRHRVKFPGVTRKRIWPPPAEEK
jgi:hypothetical protein